MRENASGAGGWIGGGTRIPCAPFPTPMFDEDGNLVGGINMLGIVNLIGRQAYDRNFSAR
jgi:hypothetical protein